MSRLTGLVVYPVKGARGTAVSRWDIDAFGLRFDRRWLVVDAHGIAVTQREHARLALLQPALEPDRLLLSAPGMPDLVLPASHPFPRTERDQQFPRTPSNQELLRTERDPQFPRTPSNQELLRTERDPQFPRTPSNQQLPRTERDQQFPRTPPDGASAQTPEGPRRSIRIWDDVVQATDLGDEAGRWISNFLGADCRVVFMPDDVVRPVNPKYAQPGDRVGFADAYPFLLISQGALGELNRRLKRPLPMNRFRPNLVVDGVPPHAEDGWARIAIGGVMFEVVKPCARCVVTTTDQETGERGHEPLRTLATYRRTNGKVHFGQNLIHQGGGELRVGDAVDVLVHRLFCRKIRCNGVPLDFSRN